MKKPRQPIDEIPTEELRKAIHAMDGDPRVDTFRWFVVYRGYGVNLVLTRDAIGQELLRRLNATIA